MPFVTVNQLRLFYRLEGNPGLPVLVFSHSIGTDHALWEPQLQDLLSHFQVLRYDARGHGASEAPPGEYSVEQMGRDVLGLVGALNLPQFAFCGLSLGGAVGQWLAMHAPEKLTGLILANTSPRIGTPELWQNRINAVQQGGMGKPRHGPPRQSTVRAAVNPGPPRSHTSGTPTHPRRAARGRRLHNRGGRPG